MDRYAVIGNPISHSSSPAIHARFAKQTEQDMRYEAIGVNADVLAEEVARLHAENYLGLNVTLPHKQAIASLCESVSDRAGRAGAVNTLIRTDSGWIGDNTDGAGLMADLQRLQFEIKGQRVLILGAPFAAFSLRCWRLSRPNWWYPIAIRGNRRSWPKTLLISGHCCRERIWHSRVIPTMSSSMPLRRVIAGRCRASLARSLPRVASVTT